MKLQEKPKEEPGYRFLQVGEIIQKSDEFWWPIEKRWVGVTDAVVGMDLDKNSGGDFRRKIT